MMLAYAALRWPPTGDPAAGVAATVQAVLQRLGWRSISAQPGWSVLADVRTTSGPVHLGPNGNRVVIGPLFDRSATEAGQVADATIARDYGEFEALCDDLLARCWGGYVAIGRDPRDPARLDIFREPIGAPECVTWQCGELRLLSSRPHILLPHAPPAEFSIAWPRVAELVALPGSAGETLPVDGVAAIPPGTFVRLHGTERIDRVKWSPASFCRADGRAPAKAAELPRLVDACVAAWSSQSTNAVAELSGGLDSAIVAAGIARARASPVRSWYQYYTADPQGDERRYARAVAACLDLPLIESECRHRVIDAGLMDALPVEVRPNVASISVFHDRDLAERGRALGADALFTGQGGDALFYQPATTDIAREIWRDPRPARAKPGMLLDLAAWTAQPIWSILRAARIDPPTTSLALPPYRTNLLSRDFARAHTGLQWMTDAADLLPAKRLQLLGLAACRGAFANSFCSQSMQVFHPLMSQPLLEHFLAIPALALTQGRRDRAMIRDAYADRLPAMLVERRGKGCLTPFFGRMLATSAPFLRSYLLEGVLAQQGILDRVTLETVLKPDFLMRQNVCAELFAALLMERWAREWTDRIATMRSSRLAPRAA